MKSVFNPPNPFQSHDCQYLEGLTPPAKLEVYTDATRTILSHNDSSDLGFRWSLNPYRGCTHACAYCYARPSHEYLGFGSGTDFETKILIKPKAPQLLRNAFMRKSWLGEMVVFSGDTDCYQPLEASYQLTRSCLEVCCEFSNPVGIITKSFLVMRDLDLLQKLNERTRLWVVVSIPFVDEKIARLLEPGAASIEKRFQILRKLSGAGIYTSVALAPIIPAVNDSDIAQLLEKANQVGAQSAFMSLLRLPSHVQDVFESKMKAIFPMRYTKIISRLKEMREGRIYQSQFGKRHRGTGDYWDNLEGIFNLTCQRLGMNERRPTAELGKKFLRPLAQKEFTFFD